MDGGDGGKLYINLVMPKSTKFCPNSAQSKIQNIIRNNHTTTSYTPRDNNNVWGGGWVAEK